jgi:hypothetical protein
MQRGMKKPCKLESSITIDQLKHQGSRRDTDDGSLVLAKQVVEVN